MRVGESARGGRAGRAGQAVERFWPLAVLALGLLILGAAVSSGHLFPNANPRDTTGPVVPQPLPSQRPTLRPGTPGAVAPGGNDWLALLVAAAVALVVLLLAFAIGHWLLARRRTRTDAALTDGDPAEGTDGPDVPDDDDLLRQVRFARADVRAAVDVRDAVISAYLSFEAAAARSGVARLAHETPGELLRRALRSSSVSPAAASRLVALYERVRYGSQQSDDAMRAEAHDCLAEIETSLAGAAR